jgi:uncharacterized cupin superfamily protein
MRPVINLFDAELAPDLDEPEGYRSPYAKVYDAVGAQRMAATIVLLGPGEAVCPYHYELAEEEWLIVLEGETAVRTPDGAETVKAGEIVCFPRGPAGAHKIANASDAPARILIVSERQETSATVYGDSDKVGVFGPDLRLLFRRGDARDYWDGEQ